MVTYSKVEFGVIPHDHWFQPDWIDEDKASKSRKQMEENGVIYGGARRGGVTCKPCERTDDSFRKSPISQHVSLQLWILLPPRTVAEVQILLASRVSRSRLPFI